MSCVIILAGVPGTGKSTILQCVTHKLPSLKVINYGDTILKEAALENIDKDSLRKLPLADQQALGLKAASRIAANLPKLVCIDTHALIKTPYGYCSGIPEAVLNILKPNIIVMIESAPQLIFDRRAADQSRKRDEDSLELIREHQEASKSFLIASTLLSKSLYASIDNNSTIENSANQLITLISSNL